MSQIRRAPGGRPGYQVRYYDPLGQRRTRTFLLKADARAFAVTVAADVVRGQWLDPSLARVTFEEYASQWIATKADVSERTRINVVGRLDNYVLPYFGSMPLAEIRPVHVRAFVAELVGKKLAPSTVKAIYLTGSQVFAQAVVDGILAGSPCQAVKLPSDRQHDEMHFLTPEQVNVLASAMPDRFRVAILTAAYTGLRAGELWALRVGRLNLLAATLDAVESVIDINGTLTSGPTKTGRRRSITLPRFLCDELGTHIGAYPSADGFVFKSAHGNQVRHQNFYRRTFRPVVAQAGLPQGLRFHDLRHTCAALLIAEGRHMEEVKHYLGHSSIRVTSDRYGHLFPQARQAIADALDATYRASLGTAAETRNETAWGTDGVQSLAEHRQTRISGG